MSGVLRSPLRAVVVALVALVLAQSPVFAGGVVWVPNTTVYNNKFEWGTVQRTIGPAQPGWSVAFKKYDGPRMDMGARPCNAFWFYDIRELADYDPPTEYEAVADPLSQGTQFCTGWIGRGGNSVDTYRGYLAWD